MRTRYSFCRFAGVGEYQYSSARHAKVVVVFHQYLGNYHVCNIEMLLERRMFDAAMYSIWRSV